MDDAVEVIKQQFSQFEGCDLFVYTDALLAGINQHRKKVNWSVVDIVCWERYNMDINWRRHMPCFFHRLIWF